MLSRPVAIGLSAAVLAVLLGYVLYPTLETFRLGLDSELYGNFFSSWRSANVRGLGNSVLVSVFTVIIGGGLGVLLAYAFYRYDFPLKGLLVTLAAVPLALPPLVGVLAFLFLYGESGILPRLIQSALGLRSVPFSFEGVGAVLLVHVYSMYVYFYLFVAAGLRSLDRSTVEASSDVGASHATTFLRVILPHLKPSITGAAILVFMISMASFTAPLLFAGTEHFMTLQIYNYKLNGDLAMSATVSTVLTMISLVFLALLEFRSGRPTGSGASKGAAGIARTVTRGWTRVASVAAAAAFILFLILPVATVVLISFAEEGSWTFQLLPTSYTIGNYVALFTDPGFLEPVVNSLIMSTVAGLANVVFGIGAALLIVQRGLAVGHIVRFLTALPFAIPGTVIAVNLIVAFNAPSGLSFGRVLVGSFWILPLAYFIRHIPLVVRATVAALERFDYRLAEASADLGASGPTTFVKVLAPAIAPAVIAGGLLTFVTALGEFVSSIMLYVFDNRPISVEILSQLRIYDFGAAAAYSVFLMILIVASTLIVKRIGVNTTTAI